jgi:hypothetical protein
VANNYKLGLAITPETLNTVIQQGYYKGTSVALLLIHNSYYGQNGRKLLSADNNKLGLAITPATLNALTIDGESVAFWLTSYPEGLAILIANDNQLGLAIHQMS